MIEKLAVGTLIWYSSISRKANLLFQSAVLSMERYIYIISSRNLICGRNVKKQRSYSVIWPFTRLINMFISTLEILTSHDVLFIALLVISWKCSPSFTALWSGQATIGWIAVKLQTKSKPTCARMRHICM